MQGLHRSMPVAYIFELASFSKIYRLENRAYWKSENRDPMVASEPQTTQNNLKSIFFEICYLILGNIHLKSVFYENLDSFPIFHIDIHIFKRTAYSIMFLRISNMFLRETLMFVFIRGGYTTAMLTSDVVEIFICRKMLDYLYLPMTG